VDGADLDVWSDNFGSVASAAASAVLVDWPSSTLLTVPQPDRLPAAPQRAQYRPPLPAMHAPYDPRPMDWPATRQVAIAAKAVTAAQPSLHVIEAAFAEFSTGAMRSAFRPAARGAAR
ncbi:MAG TPA: hypothetical protein PJ982_13660, partial [Lacipirellulaceae bacterium]|nr:hypothetical protein [Lacipirellulaceae bacterium]